MTGNERLVGRGTQLAQIEQALNRVRAGKAALLEFHGDPGMGVELAATGQTNRKIDSALHLSENTVEPHLRRSFAKLGVLAHRTSRPPDGGVLIVRSSRRWPRETWSNQWAMPFTHNVTWYRRSGRIGR